MTPRQVEPYAGKPTQSALDVRQQGSQLAGALRERDRQYVQRTLRDRLVRMNQEALDPRLVPAGPRVRERPRLVSRPDSLLAAIDPRGVRFTASDWEEEHGPLFPPDVEPISLEDMDKGTPGPEERPQPERLTSTPPPPRPLSVPVSLHAEALSGFGGRRTAPLPRPIPPSNMAQMRMLSPEDQEKMRQWRRQIDAASRLLIHEDPNVQFAARHRLDQLLSRQPKVGPPQAPTTGALGAIAAPTNQQKALAATGLTPEEQAAMRQWSAQLHQASRVMAHPDPEIAAMGRAVYRDLLERRPVPEPLRGPQPSTPPAPAFPIGPPPSF
jgi:hypothetical protein